MATVLRGYAIDKDGNLVLIGTMLSLTARINRPQGNMRKKDTWSDETIFKKVVARRPYGT